MIVALSCVLFLAPRIVWVVVCASCAAIAAHEWARLSNLFGWTRWIFIFSISLTILAWALLQVPPILGSALFLLSSVFWIVLVPYWLWRIATPKNMGFSLMAGFVVIGSASIALLVLRDADPWLLISLMSVVWISDSMGYFVGRILGRNKLAPHISPGKTWEGVAGALISVLLYAYLLGTYSVGLLPSNFTGGWSEISQLCFLMVLLAVLGIYGDLFESHLKRRAGVKDSGKILPGHGGALDRIDALLPVLPLAAWIFVP
ncbi:MAG: phosphatidate cytidylyltransferase [Burkholderiales bacterium]